MWCVPTKEVKEQDREVQHDGKEDDSERNLVVDHGEGYKLELGVVLTIFDKILKEDNIRDMLLESLIQAKAQAKQQMPETLYGYFDVIFPGCGWPTTIEEYKKYVWLYMIQPPFARKKMEMIDDLVLKSTEKSSDHERLHNYYTKCVYNEICHFYWLVNQTLKDGSTLQKIPVFASWIQNFGLANGIFLNSRESLTPKTLETFEKVEKYHLNWYNDNRKNWVSFNTFFCRELNGANPITGISPLRPIHHGKFVITSPADCTFRQVLRIDEKGVLRKNNGDPIKLKMKGFSAVSTVQDLLQFEARPWWNSFFGGTFIHYFLSPYDYHRFHTPVDGLVTAVETLNGQSYLNVRLTDGQFDAPDSDGTGYEFQQQRGLIIIDNEALGLVATLPIGMAQVSGVIMYKNKLLYRQVPKGQEFGRFVFGGSDIILLSEKPLEQLDIVRGSTEEPHQFKYGMPAVTWTEEKASNE